MATAMAPAPTRSPAAPRRLWQLPTFALGAVALYAAVTTYPPPARDPAAVARADAEALKAALARRPIDRAAVAPLAESVAAAADRLPEPAAARFLAGSGRVALAEADPASAAAHWAAAAELFAQVKADELPADDRPRYAFRSAKASAATGTGDPAAALAALNVVPAGEEKGELPRLAAAAALRLSPPDAKRARDELAAYLGGPNRLPADSAARLKLQLADLHLQLGEPDRARGWLRDIPAAAPADVQATAKLHLARLAAAENNWTEAVTQFEAAAASAGLPADQLGSVRFQTGSALAKLGRADQAAPYLEQASRDGGPVGAAAAARLAELVARDPKQKGNRAAAADLLEKAVAPPGPAPHLSPAELKAAVDAVIRAAREEADFATATRAAAAGNDREQRAELLTAWADALGTDPTAKAKRSAAAADFAALADTTTDATAKADRLRKAAAAFRAADEPEKARAAIDALLASGSVPAEQVGMALVERADLLPAADFDGKKTALEKALASPGPGAAAARHRLGSLLADRGRSTGNTAELDLGLKLLTQAADATTVGPAEKSEHETAVHDLGCWLVRAGRPADAANRFRTQLALYPSGIHADRGRLWLASALIAAAAGEKPATASDPRLAEALTVLEPLAGGKETWLRAAAEQRALSALFYMGKYDQVTARGKAGMDAHAGTADELTFGELVFFACRYANDPGEAMRTVQRLESAFEKLPAAKFPADVGRDAWAVKIARLRAEAEAAK